MQILDAVKHELDVRHAAENTQRAKRERAERTYASVYVFARGAGMSKREARENAAQSTRTVAGIRDELVEAIVETELARARVPVQ